MSKHETITATEARFPLAKLILSPMNPRQDVPEQDIKDLAGTLWAKGMIQSLAGYTEDLDGAEIVAGGTRLRALQYLAETKPDFAKLRPELANPLVMLAPDRETAADWAKMENVVRKNLPPALEIRTFGEMRAEGKDVSAIATNFGVTEKHVYRRLALADLPEPVLDALAAQEINLSMAACFTICDDEAHALAVLDRVRGENWSDHQLKKQLKPASVKATDRRVKFVGDDAYAEAGGKMGGDLFAEEKLYDSPEILDGCFQVALEDEAREIAQAEGWKWVEPITEHYLCHYTMELGKYERIYSEGADLTEEQSERYDELAELAEGEVLDEDGQAELADLQKIIDGEYTEAQKAHAGLFVYVNPQGVLERSGEMVRPEDKKDAVEAGIIKASAGSTAPAAPKSPISQALRDDLNRVAKGAQQHAILRDPDLMIDLLAYQLSHEMRWSNPFGLSQSYVPNWPSTEAAGYELDERLTTNPARDMYDAKDLGASFRAFRKKGAEHIRGELTRFLAAQYQGGDAKLAAMIAKETKPSIREVWTPTAENFFSRVGGPYMNQIWRDLLDLAEDHPTATSFAKLKKGEKAEKLESLFASAETRKAHNVTDEQAAKIDAWLPEGME
ncbi:ParB/RepB/Spo0J family partition protein [Phaeobacter inhibens]|uniref:ParB/RepB/Spo0J family partition protein n=1 Tax=Phaeobacter inhibens TaxID=221822 RepID=UPI0026E41759|nr:ParB/RepB/Spo0J family partition protein [Phaeobacter inhibens]MDO6758080.1 ParB/RepB/Spo0J family partition protein [Phaeobacter inhibens]